MYDYSITVFDYNKYARAADVCIENVPTYESNIRAAETLVGQYKAQMYLKPSSSMAEYTSGMDSYYSESRNSVVSSVSFSETRVDLQSTTSGNRQVATYVPSNLRMLQTGATTPGTSANSVTTSLNAQTGTVVSDETEVTPHLSEGEGPSMITTCVDSVGNLSGIQVWYRRFRPMAGPAHGDVSTTCTRTPINGSVVEINFFGDLSNVNAPQGVIIRMNDNSDGVYSATPVAGVNYIIAGSVNAADQIRQSFRFETNDFESCESTDAFFGFKSTSSSGVIQTLSVITYNSDQQRRLNGVGHASYSTSEE